MMNARVEEETVVDVQLGGSMIRGGSRSGGERSDPERRDPPTPAVGVVSLEGIERPDPEVPLRSRWTYIITGYRARKSHRWTRSTMWNIRKGIKKQTMNKKPVYFFAPGCTLYAPWSIRHIKKGLRKCPKSLIFLVELNGIEPSTS